MKRNAKRILSLLLALTMILTTLAACNLGGGTETTDGSQSGDAAASDDVKLWWAYNTENYMQDMLYEDPMNSRDYTLRMHGIRDDVESIQLMVTPNINVVSYDLTMNDLKSANGDVFAASNFELFAEWYVEVLESYNMDSYYGFYPDALVPLENFKTLHHNSIDAGQNQGIWVQANIPVDAVPGFYTGTAVLDLDGVKYNIPIELTIYDAEMPEQNHMASSFAIWYDYIVYGEGTYSVELADEYFWFLVEKRVMPLDPDPSKTTDYDVYIEWLLETQVNNPDIASYGLPYGTETVDGKRYVSERATMDLLTRMAKKNVELREAGDTETDLFKKAFYYLGGIIDEPSGEAVDRVRICDLTITECKFAVADAYLKDYPDLYNSLISLRHVVTTAYSEDLLGSDTTGGVQTWCPQFQHWHTEAQREEYWARQNTTDRLGGEDAWWYGCNNPKAPFPTYHLDDDNIGCRIISWMQYDYDVDGNLYWLVNNYKGLDVWYEVPTAESAGEGNLLYPGSKYGIFGPISTLRLEAIREGCEDYEMMWQMEQYILEYNEKHGTDYDPEELMDQFYEGLYSGVIPARGEHALLEEQRIALMKALEAMYTDLDAGVEALVNS